MKISIASLASRLRAIHPPLTLTPLESKKLLKLVQDSFRQQLAASARDPAAAAPDEVTPPELHLRQILPTLAAPPEEARRRQEERIKRFMFDPFGVFEEHVMLGTATLELARICFNRQANLSKNVGVDNPVVTWLLQGSKYADFNLKTILQQHRRLGESIVKALLKEGREDELLKWMVDMKGSFLLERQILEMCVKFIQTTKGLEQAAAFFLGRLQLGDLKSPSSQKHLAGLAIDLCGKMLHEIPQSPMLSEILNSSISWTGSMLSSAAVGLQFRKTEPGVRYFQKLDQNSYAFWKSREKCWLKKHVVLALEVTVACAEQQNWSDASLVAAIAERRFSIFSWFREAGFSGGMGDSVPEAGTGQEQDNIKELGILTMLRNLKNRVSTDIDRGSVSWLRVQ